MPASFSYTRIITATAILAVVATAIYFALPRGDGPDVPEKMVDEIVTTPGGDRVRLVHPSEPEKGLILFVGEAAAATTTAYAQQFAALSYNVAIIDTAALLGQGGEGSQSCIDISGKLLAMRNDLDAQLDIAADTLPIVVGANEGAAAVYVALAQDDEHRFHAAVSINFSPKLQSGSRFCHAEKFVRSQRDGSLVLAPVAHLPSSWYVFQAGATAPVEEAREFADQVSNAKFTTLDAGDASGITPVLQILQWLDPRLTDQLSADRAEGDLPLMEVAAAKVDGSQTMALLITGDGGWAAVDSGIADGLAQKGIPTVALDSLSYFWKRRTPEEAAVDIQNTMLDYMARWHRKRVILIGFSFGADVLPFIVNRIDAEYRKDIALVVLLSIGKSAAFEFHLSSWMDADKSTDRLPLPPEVGKMSWARSLCIYGVDDAVADCESLAGLGVRVINMPGDHHFDNDYPALVQHILAALPRTGDPAGAPGN
ncbi:MAG: AcvB/VirJ family lysyl-phosphatidylglycerol hydrolase [Halioglobus sp.]